MTMLNMSDLLNGNIRFRDRDIMGPMQRLSSGLRINNAADDPTSLAIINSFKGADFGVLKSIENVLDGISMIQTIDGYLSEMSDMVIRIRDLAIRASADAILREDCQDRTRLNAEAQQLIKEINRQAQVAMFNNKPILQGDLLADVKVRAGSDVAIVSTGTASAPSWVDEDTVVYTDEVTDTGAQSGTRPSSVGGATDRVFTQDINTTTNNTVGAPNQITSDPSVLVDGDADGYFDRAAGGINDPVPGDPLYPFNDPDVDGDGYRATVDNIDTDNTETGTGLNALGANLVVPISGTAYQQDFSITWNNTVTRNFGAAKVVDSVDVQANAGYDYQVQVFDTGANAWVDAGPSTTSDGAVQTIDFGADFTANSVRVVIDDPVAKVNVTQANVVISSPIRNDVELDPIATNTPPDTYKYSIAGPAQNINTFELNVTAGTNYTIYADDGTGPVAVLSGQTGTGAIEKHTLGAALVNPVDFYVELDAPGGAVANFEAYLDTEQAGGFVASAQPVTVKYDVSGVPFNVDKIKAEVSTGAIYDVFYDTGAGGADPIEIVSNKAGNTGTLDTWAVATTGPTEFYVDLDAAGTVNQFFAEDEIVLGAAAASADRITYKYTLPGAPAAIDEIQVDTSDPHEVYVDGSFLAAGAAGGVSHAYAGPAATDIYVEMTNPAGTLNSIDALNATVSVGPGVQVQVDRAFEYNFAASDLNHLEIETTAGTGYEVFVDGVSKGVGAGGALEEFNFATVAGATNVQIVLDIDAGAGDITSVYAANRQALAGQVAATRTKTYDLGAAQNYTNLDLQVTNGIDYKIYDDLGALVTSGTGTGNLEELVFAGSSANFRIDVEVGASSADIIDFKVREETTPGVGAQSTETRFYTYNVQNNPQEVSHIELDLNAAVSNVKITDSGGGTIYNGAAAAGTLTLNFAAVSTDYFNVELSIGNTSAVINSMTARNDITLQAPSSTFTDINASNENVIEYTLDNSGGEGYKYFDQLDFDVLVGHPYFIEAFDGVAWNPVTSGTGIAGAEPTYLIENYGVTSEFTAQKIRITLRSGNDTEGGEAVLTAVTNRIDRDGDNFPDVIEYKDGSDADNGLDLPFGAVAGTGVPPGPDDDNDGFLDYTALYDTFDDAANPPAGVDLNNPYGFSWQAGTGNNLNFYSGETLTPISVPSTIDSDGDTIPDTLDPFDAQAEFSTWLDGASAYRSGTLLFISNRDNATSADEDVYILSGGTYSLATPGSANAAENPALNANGTAGAWDEAGQISIYMDIGASCGNSGGTITLPNLVAGANPTFNDDTTEIAYESGGGILFAEIPTGNATKSDHSISGFNPDWNGDNIMYTTGPGESGIEIYNLVTKRVFSTGLSGTNPSWQPGTNKDEIKIAYETGGSVHVATLDLTYEPNYIQVGPNNDANQRINFSYPDARAKQIGIGYVAIDTQEGAMAGIDAADIALENLISYRAEAGQAELQLRAVMNGLYQEHINLAAARSNIEDADMASEYTELARMQILRNSAYATSAQAFSILETDRLGSIREGMGVQSIRRFIK